VRARKPGPGVRAAFAKPTAEEVAAHVRAKGYAFDPDEFWNFYESKGWRIGSHVMKSWRSACVTWQKRCNRDARREAERQARQRSKSWAAAEKKYYRDRALRKPWHDVPVK